MTDYKQQQYSDDKYHPFSEADKARSQLLLHMNHPQERKAFEDMVGYQAAYNTYIALMTRIKNES